MTFLHTHSNYSPPVERNKAQKGGAPPLGVPVLHFKKQKETNTQEVDKN